MEEAPGNGGPPCNGLFIPFLAHRLVLLHAVPKPELGVLDVTHHLQPIERLGVVHNTVVKAGRIALQILFSLYGRQD